MAWPSFSLFSSVAGFAVAVAGAFFMQFSRRPPRGIAPLVLASLLIGIASISLYVSQTPVADEMDRRPSLLDLISR